MKINHFNKTIELTKAEANKAGKYGTEAYEQLIGVQHNFPEYRLDIVKAKVKTNDGLKGLTFDYMESYIKKNGNEEQETAFADLRNAGDVMGVSSVSYGQIKKWFLEQFPEIMAYSQRIDSILKRNVA